MPTQAIDKLASLHTTLIDSRNGYTKALEEAGSDGLREVLNLLLAMRSTHISAIEGHLRAANAPVDQSGSFMSTVHRTVIGFNAMMGDLTENILPGFIDGEQRILVAYDTVIEEAKQHRESPFTDLSRQRSEIEAMIHTMEARRPKNS
jgi:uncharacterized protein (TIGR02284 family)